VEPAGGVVPAAGVVLDGAAPVGVELVGLGVVGTVMVGGVPVGVGVVGTVAVGVGKVVESLTSPCAKTSKLGASFA
jgi:hypothetical protein